MQVNSTPQIECRQKCMHDSHGAGDSRASKPQHLILEGDVLVIVDEFKVEVLLGSISCLTLKESIIAPQCSVDDPLTR